jgi:hypothetical protein
MARTCFSNWHDDRGTSVAKLAAEQMGTSAGAVHAYSDVLLPKRWCAPVSRSQFGDLALVAFLLVQGLDGFFTYMGVEAYGLHIEANPILAALMANFGEAAGLVGAKALASFLGICLYFWEIHAVVALLTGFYLTAAIAPWALILFF